MKTLVRNNEGQLFKIFRHLNKRIFNSDDDKIIFWAKKMYASPNSKLLENNIFNLTITNQKFLHLVSAVEITTTSLLKEKNLYAGIGCLGNVMYCVQAYKITANKFKLHNFGTCVMKHKLKNTILPVLFSLDLNKIKIGQICYLRTGPLLNYIRIKSGILNNNVDKSNFKKYFTNIYFLTSTFINKCLHRYNLSIGITDGESAKQIIEEISRFATIFNSLSFIYFEAVSLALMLNSTDTKSTKLLQLGEFNNNLYIDLVHNYKEKRAAKRFESYGFSPTYSELFMLINEMKLKKQVDFSDEQFSIAVANNIIFYIGISLNSKQNIEGMVFYDFCMNEENKAKYGTMLNKYLANYLHKYYKHENVDVVINSTIEKGEIGISPFIDKNKIEVYESSYSKNMQSVIVRKKLNVQIKPIESFGKL